MYTAEDILNEKNREMITATPETVIKDALKIMVENQIGAILVKENDQIVGIWTERDLMRNIISDECDISTAKLGDYMTKDLKFAPHDASIYKLLDIFLGKRFRHILIQKDEKFIGILSMGDVIKANLNQKTKELQDLNAIVSWEYYENWRFTKK